MYHVLRAGLLQTSTIFAMESLMSGLRSADGPDPAPLPPPTRNSSCGANKAGDEVSTVQQKERGMCNRKMHRTASSSSLIDDTTEADGPREQDVSFKKDDSPGGSFKSVDAPSGSMRSSHRHRGSMSPSFRIRKRNSAAHVQGMTEGDVDYLETMLPGLQDITGSGQLTINTHYHALITSAALIPLCACCCQAPRRRITTRSSSSPSSAPKRSCADCSCPSPGREPFGIQSRERRLTLTRCYFLLAACCLQQLLLRLWLALTLTNRFRPHSCHRSLALVVYTALVLPYVLGFTPTTSWEAPSWMRGVDIISDVLFMLDCVLNFFTAHVRDIDATLVTDRQEIARIYLSGWFPIDAAGSVPWELIGLIVEAAGGSLTGQAGGIQIVKILKVPKLLRLGRLFKFLTKFEGAANLGRIVLLLLLLALFIHWLAAVYFLIASSEGGWVETKLCLEAHGYFTPLSADEQQALYNASGAAAYLAPTSCVPPTSEAEFGAYILTYYTTLLMLMGENVEPTNPWETTYVVIVVLIGACVNATIFANVASLVSQITAPSAAHQARVDAIDRAMRQLDIDAVTTKRIRGYFYYRWTRHRDHAGDMFIQSLPYQLRTRTSCMVHESMIRLCPLFKSSERKFIAALSTALVPEVYLPAQFIVIAGYVSRAMYFIRRGHVQIIRKAEREFVMEGCRDFFDVLGIFTNRQHTISVRSTTHTDLYKLPREPFETIVKDYPGQGLAIADAAHQHLKPMHATLVSQRLYELVGMPDLLKVFTESRGLLHWTEKFRFKGVAKRIRAVKAQIEAMEPTLYAQRLASHQRSIEAGGQAKRREKALAKKKEALLPRGGVLTTVLSEREEASMRPSEADFSIDGSRRNFSEIHRPRRNSMSLTSGEADFSIDGMRREASSHGQHPPRRNSLVLSGQPRRNSLSLSGKSRRKSVFTGFLGHHAGAPAADESATTSNAGGKKSGAGWTELRSRRTKSVTSSATFGTVSSHADDASSRRKSMGMDSERQDGEGTFLSAAFGAIADLGDSIGLSSKNNGSRGPSPKNSMVRTAEGYSSSGQPNRRASRTHRRGSNGNILGGGSSGAFEAGGSGRGAIAVYGEEQRIMLQRVYEHISDISDMHAQRFDRIEKQLVLLVEHQRSSFPSAQGTSAQVPQMPGSASANHRLPGREDPCVAVGNGDAGRPSRANASSMAAAHQAEYSA